MMLNPGARALLDLLASRGGKPAEKSTPVEVRASDWQWLEFMGEPEPVASVQDTYISGPSAELHVRVYTPTGEGPFPCLVYFHGGGWTAGNIELADRPHRSLANATGCVLVAVNYQKAPEHPYPTALEDCAATVRWVFGHVAELQVNPAQVGVGGDSAGGNLAAAVCLDARDSGNVNLAFQLLVYPALDPTVDSPSAHSNAEGYGLTTAAMRWFWSNYVPDPAHRDDFRAAPLRAPHLRGLPPAVVVTAGYDPLRDEGERYADRLANDGVLVRRRSYPSTIHGFLWMAAALPEDFRRLMDDLGEDVDHLLDAAQRPAPGRGSD